MYPLAGSLLRKSRWDLLCSFSTIYLQPRILFRGACNFDGPSLSIMLRHDYSFIEAGTPSYVQKSGCSIELGVPFVSDYYLSVSRSVSVHTGLSYLYKVEGDSPFPFAGAGYTGSLAGRNLLVAYSSLDVYAGKNGSMYDFFAPWMFAASLGAESSVPVFPEVGYGLVLSLDTSVNIPSFIEHQVLSPGATATYSIGAPGDPNVDFLVSTKLDYLIPLALLDVPFLFGLSFLDASSRIFWNYSFGYSIATGMVEPGRSMWVGAECTLTIGYGAYYSFPLIAGIKVRFDPFFENPWNIMSDVMPYISLSIGGLFETEGDSDSHFELPIRNIMQP
jgi:hypothetical protein